MALIPVPLVLNTTGDSDTGKKRENNEDVYLVDEERGLYAVIDGMGGMEAGEIAAQLTHKAIEEFFTSEKIVALAESPDEKHIHTAFREVLEEANTRIRLHVQKNPTCRGMGCAVVAGLRLHNMLYLANLGDCRAYCLREGVLTQWTRDHSLAALLKERGELEGEIRDSKKRNRLLAAVGDDLSHLTFSARPLQPGDTLLFCSDGLWDMLPDNEIQQHLASKGSSEDKVTRLILMANDAGGEDNITVAVSEVTAA